MEVTLHRLKLLRELRRRGTVRAVAEALHYSTSTVSQQLSLLEREAGADLFARHGRRIMLTEAGELLADHADEILDAVDSAGTAIESLRDGSGATLHAGVWASVATGLLPTGLSLLAERSPGIVVHSVELMPEAGSDAVRDGSLDVAFVIDYSNYAMPSSPTLTRRLVAVEQMYVAARTDALGPGPVELASIASDPWILSDARSHFGRAVRIACRNAGFEPEVRHVVGEQPTAMALAAAGLGVTLVSDLAARTAPPGVELTPLATTFERNLSLTYRIRDENRWPVRRFVDAVVDAARAAGLRTPDATLQTTQPET
ncbi:LysR substrate-binding domain-containing protein [Gordonia liuliyuniae]|uniref:LysR substrate-binding domain-containing protein n=1 Tax=Gordonia liuliyuniae TaxID=2911517 RepID=A0ABS9IPQ8_9ACTN|nr:LysR substrate-binding domain-containing protein [Gordonia liuliyuniae]MCF8587509.1 LysR substrate-binding domain-containing protein [Gordonia liuliyuniae]